jgi:hypothetical protein
LKQRGFLQDRSTSEILSRQEEETLLNMSGGNRVVNAGEAIQNGVGQMGMIVSGQRRAYNAVRAAIFAAAQKRAMDALPQLYNGEITKAQLWDKLKLHTFDDVAQDHLDAQISQAKNTGEIADLYARMTMDDSIAEHGLKNFPWLRGTIIGRLFNQNGTFSTWERNYVARLLTRGGPMQVLGTLARYAATELATRYAEKASGMDMSSWYMAHGLEFQPAPASYEAMASSWKMMKLLPSLSGYWGDQQQWQAKQQAQRVWQTGGIKSLVTPGYHVWHDILNSMAASNAGYNPMKVLGEGIGFRPENKRTIYDDWVPSP